MHGDTPASSTMHGDTAASSAMHGDTAASSAMHGDTAASSAMHRDTAAPSAIPDHGPADSTEPAQHEPSRAVAAAAAAYDDEEGRFSIAMPAQPDEVRQYNGWHFAKAHLGPREYSVTWDETHGTDDGLAEIANALQQIAVDHVITNVRTTPADRVLTYRDGATFIGMRFVAMPTRRYTIYATAPDDEPALHDFVEAFRAR